MWLGVQQYSHPGARPLVAVHKDVRAGGGLLNEGRRRQLEAGVEPILQIGEVLEFAVPR
jgi:hypothetical protein